MQAPEGSLAQAEPHVGLHRGEVDRVLGEFAAAPRPHEAAPGIFMRRRLDEPGATDAAWAEFHESKPSCISPSLAVPKRNSPSRRRGRPAHFARFVEWRNGDSQVAFTRGWAGSTSQGCR